MRFESFLRDLSRVTSRHGATRDVDGFLRDLDRVAKDARLHREPLPTTRELQPLADFFERLREDIFAKLGGSKWFDALPSNDPLRCTVGLFTTIDFGRLETAHTRALAWLFDPAAPHEFGDALLTPFVGWTFDDGAAGVLSEVSVESEVPTTDRAGRLDVVICATRSIPGRQKERLRVIVEAKIDAAEGDEQCRRYEAHAKATGAMFNEERFVFLTGDGRHPISHGRHSRWRALSFIELVALFRPQLGHLRDKPGFDFLRLYIATVLHDLYHIDGKATSMVKNVYRISTYLGIKK